MAGSTVTHGVSPYSLNVQVDQFVYFRHRSLEMFERGLLDICAIESIQYSVLSLKDVLSSGLEGPVSKEGFESALYMMDIGHNDMVGVAHTPSDQWDKKITEIVGEVRQAISVS